MFGSRPADSIRKNEIVEWLTEQAEERAEAATTRNRWQATFSLIFRVRVDNEKIDRNPAARIRRKKEGNGRVFFRSRGEAPVRRHRGSVPGVSAPFSALVAHRDAEVIATCQISRNRE